MKKLVVVESPAKIKTISKILGADFKIMSTMGHVMDLPPKKLGVTISDKSGITLEYVPIADKAKVIAEICKAAQSAQDIFLAPDPDREGEIIAWHVNNEIKKVIKKSSKVHRIAFNEITAPAINEAIENPGVIDENMVNAQPAPPMLSPLVSF